MIPSDGIQPCQLRFDVYEMFPFERIIADRGDEILEIGSRRIFQTGDEFVNSGQLCGAHG